MNRRVAKRAAILLGALAFALSFSWGAMEGAGVSAHAPHPGLDFSIGIDADGDTSLDCASSGSPTDECALPTGAQFTVNVFLNARADIPQYEGYDIVLLYDGALAKYTLTSDFWPECAFPAMLEERFSHDWNRDNIPDDPFVALGCATAPPPLGGGPSTYTGLLATTEFTCTGSGEIIMLHHDGGAGGIGATALTEEGPNPGNGYAAVVHAEGRGTTETLTITCGEPPAPTVPAVGGVGVYPGLGGAYTQERGGAIGVVAALLAASAGAVALVAGAWFVRRRQSG